jgi:hypothetical protein
MDLPESAHHLRSVLTQGGLSLVDYLRTSLSWVIPSKARDLDGLLIDQAIFHRDPNDSTGRIPMLVMRSVPRTAC